MAGFNIVASTSTEGIFNNRNEFNVRFLNINMDDRAENVPFRRILSPGDTFFIIVVSTYLFHTVLNYTFFVARLLPCKNLVRVFNYGDSLEKLLGTTFFSPTARVVD